MPATARGPDDTPWLHLEPVLAGGDAAGLPLAVVLEAVQQCRDAADLRSRLARPNRAAEPHD